MSTTKQLLGHAVPHVQGLGEIVPLTLDQYHRMISSGILPDGTPVELVGGYIVGKDRGMGHELPDSCVMPKDPPRLAGTAELWPLSLDQYHQMIAAGILAEDDPIELIDGYLVAKDSGRGPGMPPAPEHASSTSRVNRRLSRALAETWVVRCQDPIQLGPSDIAGAGSEPQPDVAVAQGPESRYDNHHPGPADLLLVVEVSDSTLSRDRQDKAQRYASASLPRYWIVNLVDRQLEVYTDPDPATGQYRSRQVLTENAQVVLSWPGLAPVTFAVKDFLP
jgi:Uma2 family endonuclease